MSGHTGIRPEGLISTAPAEAALVGTVRTVEFLGSRSLLRVDVGATLVTAFLPPELQFAPGETIGLAPADPGRVRWFDQATGVAIETAG